MRGKGLFAALVVGILASLVMAGTTPAQMKKLELETKPMKKQSLKVKTGVIQDMGRMKAAQEWLKSIGYDKTFEQMKTMTRLNLQQYSIETASIITDANMRHVEVLTNLEILPVHRNISDVGLKHIAGLTRLKKLIISMTKVTDNSMQYLKNMPHLYQLSMDGLPITDAGLAQVKHLSPGILTLNGTQVTDQGLMDFLPNRNMKYLSLSRTAVTDALIPTLSTLSGIERIDIQGTAITQQGYNQLKAALPNTQIYYP